LHRPYPAYDAAAAAVVVGVFYLAVSFAPQLQAWLPTVPAQAAAAVDYCVLLLLLLAWWT
jgi:hypothetical protein